MFIKKVLIELTILEKIFKKHNVKMEEVEWALLRNEPRFFRAKEGRHMALAKTNRYLTIIFTCEKNSTKIITAYPSSGWQINLYKVKK
ncbi:MAG TPA: hypothetical protein VJG90_06325 [Candidatus Nanoarchaeia archaeon]|nr:hypothetical protein [Candidatus Nanoarchaeia archaeon]